CTRSDVAAALAAPPPSLAAPPPSLVAGSALARGTEVARPGTEVARPGTEVARPGTEVARPGTEVARPGTEVARPGTEVAERDGGAEQRYPGTCRDRGLADAPGLGLRVRLDASLERFVDLRHGPQEQRPSEQCGDLLLRDREGNWTY